MKTQKMPFKKGGAISINKGEIKFENETFYTTTQIGDLIEAGCLTEEEIGSLRTKGTFQAQKVPLSSPFFDSYLNIFDIGSYNGCT